MKINDDDIKIFHPKKKETMGSDLTSLAALMDKHRANGNLTKASFLGERLATFTPENFCGEDAKNLKSNELLQLRALIVFAFQIAIHAYLPHQLLSTQAVNAMYSKIEIESPGFFAHITDGSSFSFYYLTVRNNRDVEKNIGKNFAMLCEKEDNEYFVELGRRVFSDAEGKTIALIEEFEFEY